MAAVHVIRRSECGSHWNIRKSSQSVQRKSKQLYFKICNCRWHSASSVCAQSMTWKHVTSHFSTIQKVSRCCISLQSCGYCIRGFWRNCTDWLCRTWQHYNRNLLIGKCRVDWKKRDEESYVAVCYSTRTMRLLTSTDCHLKYRFRTASSPTVFTRLGPQWLLFVTKTEEIYEVTEICWRWGCYLHSKWLAEDQHQKFFYSRIRALEKCWTKCISVGGNCVGKWQDIMYIFCL